MKAHPAEIGLALVCSVALSLGCGPNPQEKERLKAAILEEIGAPPIPQDDPSRPLQPPVVRDAVDSNWLQEAQFPSDHWEIQYRGDQPVGYVHRRVEQAVSQEMGTLRLSASSRTLFQGREQEVEQKVDLVAYERENGELMRFEGTVEIGASNRRVEGLVRDGSLRLDSNISGRRIAISLPWSISDRGPFAIEQSLVRSPMKEGEVRELRYFDPIVGKPIDVTLVAYDFFETPTFEGKKESLLEIQVTSSTGDSVANSQIWVDRQGRGHKTYLPALDLRSFRCSRESAKVVVDQRQLADWSLRPLSVLSTVAESPEGGSVRYRVESIDSQYELQLPSRTSQVVRSIKGRKADVTVYPVPSLSQQIEGLEPEPLPGDEALASSFVIDANHPQVRLAAEQALEAERLASNEPAPKRVEAFAKAIAQRVNAIPFDRHVSNAHTTLAAGQGDSFDQAALLAAMCRSDGIAARIAIGLRRESKSQPMTMALSAWTEYHDGNRWIPVDASLPRDQTLTDRIKWSDSMWNTINPYDSILQVAKCLSMLEVSMLRSTP